MRRLFEHNDLTRGVNTSNEWNERWKREEVRAEASCRSAATEEAVRNQGKGEARTGPKLKGIFQADSQSAAQPPSSQPRKKISPGEPQESVKTQ
ncbi:hypothetical protein DPV78_001285 [Talaromyces pinophilus]|jgi:hypothetical protein|nr:hypothetical protein DPV78_001285 [Talaromyces pinophilus]